MDIHTKERLLDKNIAPSFSEISDLLGEKAIKRLDEFEGYLNSHYDLVRALKFPFGNNYGWGYKYSHKSKMLCYLFFEKGSFTITITIGKPELKKLYQELERMLPKTQILWENRYPCGEGGWIHYPVENDIELQDIKKLIYIKKKPKQL
ncbi:DUF3788 family protein [Sporolactobacillus laevolacticus]|uniref:DUF3788 family protein n=1 Tax=Sporolactobacillus laevolacticus TaxID=33018 RepID=UPI0025B31C9B|nr:DUF3788 family protein [Sporolactobacillus laevolacticus]MDN3956334.1 DUF3788 family protein [Sporolactobacillus laevolacticus]